MELQKKRKIFTEIETRYFLHQLVQSFIYLKNNLVIHRDLKIGNIFLNHELKIKLGDFGLAAKLSHPHDLRKTICGTPNYIAPEILKLNNATSSQDKKGYSFEVDLWSIGVVIYTLLIGRPPYQAKEVKATYKRISQNIYSYPEGISISDKTKDLINCLLQLDPKNRISLEDILRHSFFTDPDAYLPPSLPDTILVSPPVFPGVTSSKKEHREISNPNSENDPNLANKIKSYTGSYSQIPTRYNSMASLNKPSSISNSTASLLNLNKNLTTSNNNNPSSSEGINTRKPIARPSSSSIPTLSSYKTSGKFEIYQDNPTSQYQTNEYPSTNTYSSTYSSANNNNNPSSPNLDEIVSTLKQINIESPPISSRTQYSKYSTNVENDGNYSDVDNQTTATYTTCYSQSAQIPKTSSYEYTSPTKMSLDQNTEAIIQQSRKVREAWAASSQQFKQMNEIRKNTLQNITNSITNSNNISNNLSMNQSMTNLRQSLTSGYSTYNPSSLINNYKGSDLSHSIDSTSSYKTTSTTTQNANTYTSPSNQNNNYQTPTKQYNYELEDAEEPENNDKYSTPNCPIKVPTRPDTIENMYSLLTKAPTSSPTSQTKSGLSPEVYITKYVDYTSKYGIGFLLNTKSIGVFFNDTSTIVTCPRGKVCMYTERKRNENGATVHTQFKFHINNYSEELHKKVTLLKHFKEYLLGKNNSNTDPNNPNVISTKFTTNINFDTDDNEEIDENTYPITSYMSPYNLAYQLPPSAEGSEQKYYPISPSCPPMPYLKKWVRTTHAILFRLSDSIVQVIFFDNSQIILLGNSSNFIFFNKQREKSIFHLDNIMASNRSDVFKRLKYTKEIMARLMNQQTSSQN